MADDLESRIELPMGMGISNKLKLYYIITSTLLKEIFESPLKSSYFTIENNYLVVSRK